MGNYENYSGEQPVFIEENVVQNQTIEQQHAVDLDALKRGVHEASRSAGSLTYIAEMIALWAGSWDGAITTRGEKGLQEEVQQKYLDIIHEGMVPTAKHGRRACMDGRTPEGYDDSVLEQFVAPQAPKTAGGTIGDALAFRNAYNMLNPDSPISIEGALDYIIELDASFGYLPGGHALGQCGRKIHAGNSRQMIATKPELVIPGVETFFNATGYGDAYNAELQRDLIAYTQSSQQDIPVDAVIESYLTKHGQNCLPVLANTHEEKIAVIGKNANMTLHTGHVNTRIQNELGVEAQAFDYNLGFHVARAQKMDGLLGTAYLHAVASDDVPVLPKLADGSLGLFLYE